MSMQRILVSFALAATIAAAACGGSSAEPTSPTQQPSGGNSGGAQSSATITITSAGISPKAVTVARGGTILFVNNDSVVHVPSSNPHPVHTDCPDVNVGSLSTGQSRATQALTIARTCGFHDHNNPQNAALHGTITIQ
jgi:plastocyanin